MTSEGLGLDFVCTSDVAAFPSQRKLLPYFPVLTKFSARIPEFYNFHTY